MNLRNRLLATVLFPAVLYGCSLYLTGCTTAQRAHLLSDGKALLGIGERAAIDFTAAELKAAAEGR